MNSLIKRRVAQHVIKRNGLFQVKSSRFSSSKQEETLSTSTEDPPIYAPLPPPPPCGGPPCPPPICPVLPDPNNPCNYCPPDPHDPDAVDMTKLKKAQCNFQADDDTPVYLKHGNPGVYYMRVIYTMAALSVALALQTLYKLLQK